MFKSSLKVAFRNLWKNKSFSLINIGGLAIGLAGCILLLMYVAYEWNYNKQLPNHDRVYVLYTEQFGEDQIFCFPATPAPLAPAIGQSVPGVAAIARTAYVSSFENDGGLLSYNNNIFTKDGLYADSSFFRIFKYHFIEGNTQTALNEPNSIVLTKKMANILFQNEDPLNRVIKWNNEENLRVTGIIENPPSNSWSKNINYVVTWHLLQKEYPQTKNSSWGGNFCLAFLLLKDNQYFTSADKLVRKMIPAHQVGITNPNQAFLFPLSKWYLYDHFENGKSVGGKISQLRTFLVLAFCILLIACINFMNLSTARTQKRAKEVGIRKIAGSSRFILIRQFIGESALFVFISIIIALILVELTLPFFNNLLGIQLDIVYSSWYFWIGLFIIFIITSLIAGSYPAFYLSSFVPARVLKGVTKTGRGASSLRKVLVVFQFLFTITLIIFVTVIFLQINYIRKRPVGYDQNNLVEIPLTGNLKNKVQVLKKELLNSGMVSAACPLSISLTQGGYNGFGVNWPGNPQDKKVLFDILYTGFDFEKTTGIDIIRGRGFSKQYSSDSTAVLINETAAKVMNLENPIGATINSFGRQVHIVGIFKDLVKSSPFYKANPMIVGIHNEYRMMETRINPEKNVVQAVNIIENIQKKLNPNYPPQVNFVTQEFEQKFKSEKLLSTLANLFGGLAIFISCLGLFGLALFTAEQRTKEIGIRRVLGASKNRLMLLVSKDFIILVIIAAIFACPIAYYFMEKWLSKFYYRIHIGWYVFVFAFLMAFVIALISVGWQAWRSTSANLADTLKYE